MPSETITLFHSPQTRSSGALTLLEELGAPYTLRVLNMKAGEQRQAEYLAVNPMGKVPAILHGDALITEQVAIGIYLADLFPQAGITPAIGSELRGPYLRWYVFYAACFEPALVDKSLKREAGPAAMVPYGDPATTINTVVSQLSKGPWLLGEQFHGSRCVVGYGTHLDDGIRTRRCGAADQSLCGALERATLGAEGRRDRRSAGCRAGRVLTGPRKAGFELGNADHDAPDAALVVLRQRHRVGSQIGKQQIGRGLHWSSAAIDATSNPVHATY